MKSILRIVVLSWLACVPAHDYEVEAGAITICDTQKQAKRFVQLFDGNTQIAIRAVNTEEHDPNACAMADVSYVQGPSLGVARSASHAFEIVPIVVFGVRTPTGYRQVAPAVFFTLV